MRHARAVVSGAVCAVALCLGGLIGPSGAALALLAVPLPTLVIGGVAGVAHAAASSLAAGSMLGGLLGWPVGVSYLMLAGAPGVLAVLMLRRAWRLEVVLPAAIGLTFAGLGGLAVLFAPGTGSWAAALGDAWRNSFDGALTLYRDFGMSAEQVAEIQTQRDQLAQSALHFLPALLVVGVSGLWLANLRLSARWAAWPQLHALSRWRAPDGVIWLLIASGFGLFAPQPIVAVVAGNVFAIVLACYFGQGLAIVSYFFQRFRLPRGLRLATYVVIALQQVAAVLVVALGVFDLWGDFRQLTAHPADATVGSDSK
jgi:uncharacterized protein YybS (DUF2232 family)